MSAVGFNRTILHVDDDADFTRLVAQRLGRRGIEVASLNDPARALEEIMLSGYRIVLLDIDMPTLDGLQLLAKIKEHDAGIQVIMLTGVVTLSNALAAYRGGAEALFCKPLEDVDELAGAVETSLRKIDYWWLALHNLTKRRRQLEIAAGNPPPALADATA